MHLSNLLKSAFLLIPISAYTLIFFQLNSNLEASSEHLEFPPPLPIQQFSSGYTKQLTAEFTYIKAAIYLGGSTSLSQHDLYADSLTSHCFNMIHLHPYLLDSYYLCESSLAWLDDQYAENVSELLNFGHTSLSDEWVLPFFVGFNYFYFLQQPEKAASFIQKAAVMDRSPRWLPSLANTLLAKAGNLETPLAWLKLMYADETSLVAKLRYKSDIQSFEQAIKVQHALENYRADFNVMPSNLNQLVPRYIDTVRLMRGRYDLQYDDQHTLRMLRKPKKTKRVHTH